MLRSVVTSLAFATAMLPVAGTPQSPNPIINATGNWNVNPTGEALASGVLRLRQDGSTVAGSYGQVGTIDGKFEPGTLQVDATWSDSRGKGWMTILFTADGNRFSGEWGRPGSKPSGHFDAARSVYPIVTRHAVERHDGHGQQHSYWDMAGGQRTRLDQVEVRR
jgi:hypothetical protein